MIEKRRTLILWSFLLIEIFLILGCSTTVPVRAKFPTAPERLMQQCPQLEKLEKESKLSDIAKSVTNNYTKYHKCSIQNDLWIEWYRVQKKIFEEIK